MLITKFVGKSSNSDRTWTCTVCTPDEASEEQSSVFKGCQLHFSDSFATGKRIKHGCFTVTMAFVYIYINCLTFKPVSPEWQFMRQMIKKEKQTVADQSQGKTRYKSYLAVQQCIQTVAWRNTDSWQQSSWNSPALCFYSRQAALCKDLISPFSLQVT